MVIGAKLIIAISHLILSKNSKVKIRIITIINQVDKKKDV
jgi:hypothetical protein